MSDFPVEQYNLLLVGRSGNGKSSTGNVILNKTFFKAFQINATNDDDIAVGSAVVDGHKLCVIDGTGIGDTGQDAKLDILSLTDSINKTLWDDVGSVHAIICVFKYGVRYTKQEKDAVEQVKSIFGLNVLKNWGIIVMTYGDNFKLDNEDENVTFEDWFKGQTGDIHNLIIECDNRCVLFNNKEKDEKKKRHQREELIRNVKAIQSRPYTKEDFEDSSKGRVKLLLKTKIPSMELETKKIIGEINAKLADVEMKENPLEVTDKLNICYKELMNFKAYLENEDEGSGLLDKLIMQVEVTESRVKSKIKLRASDGSQSERHGTTTIDIPPADKRKRMITELQDTAGLEKHGSLTKESVSNRRRDKPFLGIPQSRKRMFVVIIMVAIIIIIITAVACGVALS